jgi:HEAT repeat protein
MHYFHRATALATASRGTQRTVGLVAVVFLTSASVWAADSVEQLAKAAARGDESARVAAIDGLADHGPAAKAAVADLVALLADPSARIRAHAAYALGMIGLEAKAAAPELVKATADADQHVRREAIQALELTKPGIDVAGPALLKALEDKEPAVQVAALDALADIGTEAVPTLAQALANPATRYWAALALGEFGPDAKPAVPALTEALDDKRPEIVHEVLIALAQIGPDAASAEPKVTPLLMAQVPFVRNPAAYALGRMGPAAIGAKPALEQGAKSDDVMLRTVCYYALAKIDPNDKAARDQAVKLLKEALHNPDPRIESAAVRGLIELQTPPADFASELTQCIVACDRSMVPEMMAVLAASGESGLPALTAALKRPESRGQAAVLLGRIGPAAHTAVPALAESIGDENPEVRREVLYALGAIIADKGPADPRIVAALDDPELRVRATAAYALGRAGASAKGAVPKLKTHLESDDQLVRVVSAWALAHIAPQDAQMVGTIVPVLIHGTKNDSYTVRRGAADALGRLGPAASSAMASLKALESDPDASVRAAAAAAIEKIGGDTKAPKAKAGK